MNNYLVETYEPAKSGYEITGSYYADTKEKAYQIASLHSYYMIWKLVKDSHPNDNSY